MALWIAQNLATLIISGVLLAVVSAVIVSLVKKRKSGGASCGCGCSDCPMGGACHQKK